MPSPRPYTLACLLLGVLSLASCRKEAHEPTPTERMQTNQSLLTETLRSAPRGWVMTYFSRCDSLLFTSPERKIGHGDYRDRYGYGGHCMAMRFGEHEVEMLADWEAETMTKSIVSPYAIGQRTSTNLSFTLYTYIHRLINDRFAGSADLLYQGRDLRGALVFTTASYAHPGHEYIRLEAIAEGDTPQSVMERAYKYRRRFETMANPQLVVRQGERIYYRSNYFLKSQASTNIPLLEEISTKRYYLFLETDTDDPFAIQRDGYRGFSALGSGYVGTKDGLSFRPGLYASATVRVHDFALVGDRFVAELVEVYDPVLRTTSIESKHLYPSGTPTGFVAEIWDAPIPPNR